MTRRRRMALGCTSQQSDPESTAPSLSILLHFDDGQEAAALRLFNAEVAKMRRQLERTARPPKSVAEAKILLAEQIRAHLRAQKVIGPDATSEPIATADEIEARWAVESGMEPRRDNDLISRCAASEADRIVTECTHRASRSGWSEAQLIDAIEDRRQWIIDFEEIPR